MNIELCLKRHVTKTDEVGKPLKNIANYGLLSMETAKVMRNGEYFGVEIQAIDHILPLFTTQNMTKTYDLLLKDDYQTIIQILKIEKEYTSYGNDIIHYIIRKWCEVVKIDCPPKIKPITDIKINENDLKNLNRRISLNRSDGIMGKFKIVNIGQNTNTGTNVLPIEWIDKEFDSAKLLHSEMDKLDYRIGSPPVTYCCTYGMIITSESDKKQWISADSYDFKLAKYDIFLVVDKNPLSNTQPTKSIKSYLTTNIKNVLKSKKMYELVFLPNQKHLKMLILVEKNIFIRTNVKKYLTKENTSYLSSLLQKCFRDHNAKELLEETIAKLHFSAGYNLPDQHFARVSGCRQLCWRSFISIIEDVSPYNITNNNELDLLDLFTLSYISHIDSNVLLDPTLLEQFTTSLTKCQANTKCWNWRKGKDIFADRNYENIVQNIKMSDNIYENRNANSFLFALILMPMMKNDFIMLSKGFDYLKTFEPQLLNKITPSLEKYDSALNMEIKMTAMDMHCFPYILIQLQGSLPFIPTKKYTLQNLSKFMWQNSSGINNRYLFPEKNLSLHSKNDLVVLRTIYDIQYISLNGHDSEVDHSWIISSNTNTQGKITKFNSSVSKISQNIPKYISRLAFLLIFGKKYKLNKKVGNKQYDVIICGTSKFPCKVKKSIDRQKMTYVEKKERYEVEKEFVLQFNDTFSTKLINPPTGYKWKDFLTGITKPQNLSVKISKDFPLDFSHELEFFIGNIKIKPFDGSDLIEKISDDVNSNNSEKIQMPETFAEHINKVFYNNHGDIFETLLELFRIAKLRLENSHTIIYDWVNFIDVKNTKLMIVLMYVRSKIIMTRGFLQIGPVDRSGNKTQYSVNYMYEGSIWRIMIGLCALYPDTCIPVSPYKIKIITVTNGYNHLLNTLNLLCENTTNVKNITNIETQNMPKLKTKLWEHQEKSINKIIYGMTIDKRKGFGDASDVGSGKTLTALGTIIEIIEYLKKTKLKITNNGFLILLPTDKLFEVWQTEIEKHTTGFNVYTQKSDGNLVNIKTNSTVDSTVKQIQINLQSIVITTMGRCRDHPIVHPWILTIIDECLTVQNKDALQTEEAWRQCSYSYFGVLMLSATFFRSRFDKMLYMLSMLNTGLPETSEYLDTILSESMVCNLGEKERKWIVNINNKYLSKEQQEKYNKIAKQHTELGFEKVYHLLDGFIRNNVNYINIFLKTIDQITQTRPTSKILIYTTSKTEADNLSTKKPTIGRYPDITKNHVVVSYAEGTYGLNNLIEFDTILSRIPESDKLPQMKGRLDRPGQKNNVLYLEYVFLENTIESANLYKLEIANNFYGNHLLPLAEYYKMAVVGKQ